MRDTSEREAISVIATTLGIELNPVEAVAGHAEPNDEVVFGLGDVAEDARLYAHLTGRRAVSGDLRDLANGAPPAVIVLCQATLGDGLMQWLQELPSEIQQPGVIWGRTPSELRQRALVCAAAARFDGRLPTLKRVDVEFSSPTGVIGTKTRRLIGAQATGGEVREILQTRTGLLTFHVHGTAWSFTLKGGDMALCMLHEPHADLDKTQAPYCVTSGYCPAVRRPVREAIRSHLLDPEVLAARVLVIASCNAIPLGTSAVGPEWALFPQLQSNPAIGAILASHQILALSYREVSHYLLRALEGGIPVGKALTEFERAPYVSKLGQRLFLFGDPLTRGGDKSALESLDENAAAIDPAAPTDLDFNPDIEVLRALSNTQRDDSPDSGTTALALSDALDLFEAAVRGERRIAPSRAEGPIREATLRHIKTLRGRTGMQGRSPDSLDRGELVPCPGCGWPCRPYRWTRRDWERRSLHCPRCTEVSDLPAGSSFDVEVQRPNVSLKGAVPTEQWNAALYLAPARNTQVRMYRWPAAADGSPARSLSVKSNEWPEGPLEVRVVLLEGVRLFSVARLINGTQRSRAAG